MPSRIPRPYNCRGDAEAEVAVLEQCFKVGRRQGFGSARVGLAAGENVGTAEDGEELMDAAIRRAIRLFHEAHFADRTVLLDEGRGRIGSALACGIRWNMGFSGARCRLEGSCGLGTRKPPGQPGAGWLCIRCPCRR
jgi:hypothetical protein